LNEKRQRQQEAADEKTLLAKWSLIKPIKNEQSKAQSMWMEALADTTIRVIVPKLERQREHAEKKEQSKALSMWMGALAIAACATGNLTSSPKKRRKETDMLEADKRHRGQAEISDYDSLIRDAEMEGQE
jgi:hypothetical protein